MNHPDPKIDALLARLAHPALGVIDLSLDRVRALLQALGSPQDRLPPVVHVAGTNGKGSLLAYLTAALSAGGYRVHRYISPHLMRFNERIMLNGQDIDDNRLHALLKKVEKAAASHPVTFFEATTAAAFCAFAETPADIVLLETGLGGRLDATNCIANPLLTAITPVSFDHMEFLGARLESIAAEKAGILKTGVPAVIGPQEDEAGQVIDYTANHISVPLYRAGVEWDATGTASGFRYRSALREMVYPEPNLAGMHQRMNAATMIACADRLNHVFPLEESHLQAGIKRASWPARLQRLQDGALSRLLPEKSELWLDGGHNPAAGEAIADWMRTQRKPIHVICGMLGNKDIKGFLRPITPYARALYAVGIPGESGAFAPEVISETARQAGLTCYVSKSVRNAIKSIVLKEENGYYILICGSLYLAGNILWQNSPEV